MQLEARLLSSRLKHGLILNHSRIEGQRLLPVVKCSHGGFSGFGEAPPLPTFTGESAESTVGNICRAASELELYSPKKALDIIHKSPHQLTSQTRAALDIALHDLIARQDNQPLHQLLGFATTQSIRVSRAIGFHTLEQTVALAGDYISRGVTAIKLKVGRKAEVDAEIIHAVREAVGNTTELTIDANEGLTVRDAQNLAHAARQANIAYFEQPVHRDDLDGLRTIRATGVPVLADESLFTVTDARRLIGAKAADIFALKLIKCGGLQPALEIVKVAHEHGIPVIVIDPLGSAVSLNAGLHLAAIIGDTHYAHGLSAGLDVETTYAPHQPLAQGQLVVPSRPGLGIDVAWPIQDQQPDLC